MQQNTHNGLREVKNLHSLDYILPKVQNLKDKNPLINYNTLDTILSITRMSNGKEKLFLSENLYSTNGSKVKPGALFLRKGVVEESQILKIIENCQKWGINSIYLEKPLHEYFKASDDIIRNMVKEDTKEIIKSIPIEAFQDEEVQKEILTIHKQIALNDFSLQDIYNLKFAFPNVYKKGIQNSILSMKLALDSGEQEKDVLKLGHDALLIDIGKSYNKIKELKQAYNNYVNRPNSTEELLLIKLSTVMSQKYINNLSQKDIIEREIIENIEQIIATPELFEKEDIEKVNPILFYKENNNGTGAFGFSKDNIPNLAKILRVSHEFVELINNKYPEKDQIPEALWQILLESGNDRKFEPIYSALLVTYFNDIFDVNKLTISKKIDSYRNLMRIKSELQEEEIKQKKKYEHEILVFNKIKHGQEIMKFESQERLVKIKRTLNSIETCYIINMKNKYEEMFKRHLYHDLRNQFFINTGNFGFIIDSLLEKKNNHPDQIINSIYTEIKSNETNFISAIDYLQQFYPSEKKSSNDNQKNNLDNKNNEQSLLDKIEKLYLKMNLNKSNINNKFQKDALNKIIHGHYLGEAVNLLLGPILDLKRKYADFKIILENNDQELVQDLSSNFESICKGISRTINLIESFKNDYSIIDHNFIKNPYNIVEKIESVSKIIENYPTLKKRNKIQVKTYFGTNLITNVEPSKLERVLTNLHLNAYQAMNDGDGGVLTIKAVYEPNSNQIIIRYHNTGPLIPKEIQEKLGKIEKVTTKTYGIGLGIPLSKNIIEGMNGKIDWVSNEIEGTYFTIMIPAYQNGSKKS